MPLSNKKEHMSLSKLLSLVLYLLVCDDIFFFVLTSKLECLSLYDLLNLLIFVGKTMITKLSRYVLTKVLKKEGEGFEFCRILFDFVRK
jgi:hypothetical protein